MATYKIDNIKQVGEMTTFDVIWTKNDGTVIGPHYHEIQSLKDEDIYSQLDISAASLEPVKEEEI